MEKKECEIQKDEQLAVKTQQKAGRIQEDCQIKLQKAEPALLEAEQALYQLQTNDFVEMRMYKKPPAVIVTLFEALFTIMGI